MKLNIVKRLSFITFSILLWTHFFAMTGVQAMENINSDREHKENLRPLNENLKTEENFYKHIQCLWHLNTPIYRKNALNMLAERARNGDEIAATRYLKKLSSTKEYLPRVDEKELQKFYEFAINSFPEWHSLSPENKLALCKRKLYFQMLLDPSSDLYNRLGKEIKESLDCTVVNDELLQLKLESFRLLSNLQLIAKLNSEESVNAFRNRLMSIAEKKAVHPEYSSDISRYSAKLYRRIVNYPYPYYLGKDKGWKLTCYHRADNHGDPVAAYLLGCILEKDYAELEAEETEKNKAENLSHIEQNFSPIDLKNIFSRSAGKGNALGKYKYAQILESEDGNSLPFVLPFIISLYQEAAIDGHPDAAFRYYCLMVQQKQDLAEAILFLKDAAQSGHAQAQKALGELYWYGKNMKQDYHQANHWFIQSGAKGVKEVNYYLGLAAEKGLGRDRNDKEAFDAYAKANLEVTGVQPANQALIAKVKLRLGRLYKTGRKESNWPEVAALSYFEESRSLGNTKAAYHAGALCLQGWQGHADEKSEATQLKQVIPPNYALAYKYIDQAAQAGKGKAMFVLGLMHQLGYGVKQDYRAAVDWYDKVKIERKQEGLFRAYAMYQLGLMSKEWTGIPKDLNQAQNYFRCAGYLDHKGSQWQMGKALFYKGEFKTAFSWLCKIEGIYSDALYLRATLYRWFGFQDATFKQHAKALYEKLAEHEHVPSLIALGHLLEEEGDRQKAIEYYQKAACRHNPKAFHALARIYKESSEPDISLTHSEAAANEERLLTLKRLAKADHKATSLLPEKLVDQFLEAYRSQAHPIALKLLTQLYLEGRLVRQDSMGEMALLFEEAKQRRLFSALKHLENLSEMGGREAVEEMKEVGYFHNIPSQEIDSLCHPFPWQAHETPDPVELQLLTSYEWEKLATLLQAKAERTQKIVEKKEREQKSAIDRINKIAEEEKASLTKQAKKKEAEQKVAVEQVKKIAEKEKASLANSLNESKKEILTLKQDLQKSKAESVQHLAKLEKSIAFVQQLRESIPFAVIGHYLKTLSGYLDKRNLRCLRLVNLPEDVNVIRNAKELDVQNNELKSLPSEFKYLSSVTTLILRDNMLSYSLSILKDFKALTTLDLSQNQIHDSNLKFLAECHLSLLTSLNLEKNMISAKGVEDLGNFEALTSLNLNYNNIGDEGFKALMTGSMTTLTTLELRKNKITDEGVKTIFDYHTDNKLRSLTTLDLAENEIGDKGAKAIATANRDSLSMRRRGLNSLRSLDLRKNNIGDEGKKALNESNCRSNKVWKALF